MVIVLRMYYIMSMPKRRLEPTNNRSVRLPNRLWDLLDKAAGDREIYTNNMIWRMAEDFLVKHGYLKKADRKREPMK